MNTKPFTPQARDRTIAALAEFWAETGAIAQDEADALVSLASKKTPGTPPRTAQRSPSEGSSKTATQNATAPRKRGLSPVAVAEEAARRAVTLEDLKAAIAGFDLCPLKASARNTVVYDGQLDAEVMLVGEAPGAEEDAQGLPFIGRSGKLLDRMLATIGLSRTNNLYITNTVYWRPPGNRDPHPDEMAVCAPFLARQIELKRPKMLLTAGKPAAQALLRTDEGIMRLHGRRLTYEQNGLAPIPCIPLLHPSYLLRRPPDKAHAWADMLVVASLCEELGITRDGAL